MPFATMTDFGDTVAKAWNSVFDRAYPVVASTCLYGFSLYWIFYLFSASAWVASGAGGIENTTNVLAAHKARAKTAAYTISACLLIYAAFLLIGDIGLDVNQVVQIGSVFSIGLSWSMRDSLSSLWASLLLSLTTDIIKGATIRYNGAWYRVLGKRATYVECAWLATRAGPGDTWNAIQDPMVQKMALRQRQQGEMKTDWHVVGNFIRFIPATALLQGGYDTTTACELSSV
jgi:hypothetical protein